MTTARLVAHCGGVPATREEVFALSAPEHTNSWKPVAYRDAIEMLHGTVRRQLGLELVAEQYALNKAGTQLFHVARFDTGTEESGLAIGLRQSYDKSLALGVVAGAQVFVCDNLCFSGDQFEVLRKNTTNVWEDFKALIRARVGAAQGAYESMQVDFNALKSVPCPLRRGYAYLGVLQGEGILKPTQANVAFADWTEARHEEFAERNLWGLYNAVTEGLKKGAAADIIDRHTNAHGWFQTEMARLGVRQLN